MSNNHRHVEDTQNESSFSTSHRAYQDGYEGYYQREPFDRPLHSNYSYYEMQAKNDNRVTAPYFGYTSGGVDAKPRARGPHQLNHPSHHEVHHPPNSYINQSTSAPREYDRLYPAYVSLGSAESFERIAANDAEVACTQHPPMLWNQQHGAYQESYQRDNAYQDSNTHQCNPHEPLPLSYETAGNGDRSTRYRQSQLQPQTMPSSSDIQIWQDQLRSWPETRCSERPSLMPAEHTTNPGQLEQIDEECENLEPIAIFAPSSSSLPVREYASLYSTDQTRQHGWQLSEPSSPDEVQSTVAANSNPATCITSTDVAPEHKTPTRKLQEGSADGTPRVSNGSRKKSRTSTALANTTRKARVQTIPHSFDWPGTNLGPIGALGTSRAMPLQPRLGFYKCGELTQQAAAHMLSLQKLSPCNSPASKKQKGDTKTPI